MDEELSWTPDRIIIHLRTDVEGRRKRVRPVLQYKGRTVGGAEVLRARARARALVMRYGIP